MSWKSETNLEMEELAKILIWNTHSTTVNNEGDILPVLQNIQSPFYLGWTIIGQKFPGASMEMITKSATTEVPWMTQRAFLLCKMDRTHLELGALIFFESA